MKIVMLCDFYNETLQYQENLLAKYYIKHGHQVTVIASTFNNAFDYISDKYDKNQLESEYIYNEIRIIKQPYSLNILNKLRKLKKVAKILKNEKPQLIFVHNLHLNISDAVQYKKENPDCKIIIDFHTDFSNSAKNWISLNILHKIIRKYLFNKAKKYINKIFYVVPSSKEFLNIVYSVPNNEMELLPLGSDTDLIKELMLENNRIGIRIKYNINTEDIVIITGGKLTPLKKTDILIKAFQELQNKKLHLMIIGDAGPNDERYKEYLLKISNESERIHFTGWLSGTDVYNYMSASDLAVFPASQSILWQQAISMELPLLVGNTGNQSISYLNKHDNIIILDQNEINCEIIKENILRLLNNKSLMETMKMGARITTEEFLNYNNIILKTLN